MPVIHPRFGLVFTQKADALKYDKHPYSFGLWAPEQKGKPYGERGPQPMYYIVNGQQDRDKDAYGEAVDAYHAHLFHTRLDTGEHVIETLGFPDDVREQAV